jgi:hypothetical protein
MIPAEDLKGYTDLLVSLVGTGGIGAAVLAFLGYLKSRAERPASLPPDSPTIGPAGMQAIGGALAAGHHMDELAQYTRLLRHTADDHEEHGRRTARLLDRFERAIDKLEDKAA